MKKSLVALAVLAASASASAVTVYDKDGTSFAVGGRVQAVVYSGDFNKVADHDTGLVNSARLNLAGKTKVNDYLSVFAFSEWNMADGNKSATGDNMNTRDQYIGADFGSYGVLTAGKQFDAFYAVQSATDIFEDCGSVMAGDTNGERRTGTFAYTYDNNGFFAKAAAQTAQDDVSVAGIKSNINGGYSGSLGYTFDDVVFGPLSIKAGYTYVEGQNDVLSSKAFDNYKSEGASIAWGSLDSGLYLAALYEQNRHKARVGAVNSSSTQISEGYEFVAGYTFDNGLGVFTGLEQKNTKNRLKFISNDKQLVRRIPVFANYSVCSNFNVWAEAEFDANSSKASDRKNKLAIGGRYTF